MHRLGQWPGSKNDVTSGLFVAISGVAEGNQKYQPRSGLAEDWTKKGIFIVWPMSSRVLWECTVSRSLTQISNYYNPGQLTLPSPKRNMNGNHTLHFICVLDWGLTVLPPRCWGWGALWWQGDPEGWGELALPVDSGTRIHFQTFFTQLSAFKHFEGPWGDRLAQMG